MNKNSFTIVLKTLNHVQEVLSNITELAEKAADPDKLLLELK